MATRADAGKKGARAQAQAKGARAQAQEKGVCIICGEEAQGTPAANDFPVRFARWLRSAFKQPAKHTIACKGHLDEARARRAKYEKKVRDYLIGAALIFVLIAAGGVIFGRADIGLFVPAFLGGLAVALLPCFYYFPSFGK
ncbi:MAG: hypothetical protein NTX79_08145 [Candidatus Micrarchaeota archaeon]|nr:hypothetical protein [Candidatus Micrarchaeota archaeon]